MPTTTESAQSPMKCPLPIHTSLYFYSTAATWHTNLYYTVLFVHYLLLKLMCFCIETLSSQCEIQHQNMSAVEPLYVCRIRQDQVINSRHNILNISAAKKEQSTSSICFGFLLFHDHHPHPHPHQLHNTHMTNVSPASVLSPFFQQQQLKWALNMKLRVDES